MKNPLKNRTREGRVRFETLFKGYYDSKRVNKSMSYCFT